MRPREERYALKSVGCTDGSPRIYGGTLSNNDMNQNSRPFLIGDAKYEFSKTKKHFLVFGNSYSVFFGYQTYRSSVTNTSLF